MNIEEFIAERDAALLSLDEIKIRALFRKFNGKEMPSDPEIFWTSVHKAITGATSLPIAFRKASKAWLSERGFQSLDDGEL